MSQSHPPYSLAELLIVACAEAWRDAGEVQATGIGPIPRLAASLAKTTFNPAMQMTDGEAWYVTDPVPPGPRQSQPEFESWCPYDRVFHILWSGRRHAMLSPVQMDRFGQTNISVIGDHARPKTAMLGVRGFPGNTICHPNSFFIPQHSKRSFVAGEVDYVCGAGYNPDRYLNGRPSPGLDLRLIVTNLAVMDFAGPDHAIQVRSLHPGVSFDEVQDNTGFTLKRPDVIPETRAPTAEELALIARLDPNGVRRKVLKGDPVGDRRLAEVG
ncbi:CoA-transferase subunit beta [Brevundimonas sp.]|uniref:CoA-transferase subunit beta n=1 Tax=Brevundimonas sp. TaxID=1871086 RepID=UPI003D6D685D